MSNNIIDVLTLEDLERVSSSIDKAYKNHENISIRYNGTTVPSFDYFSPYDFKDSVRHIICKDQIRKMAEELNVQEAHVITKEKVVQAMKFICEHPNLEYFDAIKGLMELGIYFDLSDVHRVFSNAEGKQWHEALTTSYYPTGAYLVANLFEEVRNHLYTREEFFSVDKEVSAWEYIRNATQDKNYTKENIQNNAKETK